MNDNRPICPYCIVDIGDVEMTDDSFDTSTYEVSWRGTCPVCDKHFTWKEIYRYSRMDCFEEEIDDG